jgi:hypothetical protein
VIKRSTLILFEVVAGLLAIVALGLGLMAWRLSQGPMPLAMLETQLETQLSAARDGRKVDIDDVALAWAGGAKGLQLVAGKVRVYDADGKEQTGADGLHLGIDLASLAFGRLAISSLDVRGGALTITLRADRSATLAFGGPGSAPDLFIPAPAENRPLLEQVEWVLDAMAQAMAPLGPGGQLRSLAASGLHLTIQDEQGGAIWKATDARLSGVRTGRVIKLNAAANFTGPRGPAPATLAITTDEAFASALIEFIARDVRLNALLPSQILGPLEKFRAPVTAAVTVGVDRAQGVNRIEGDVTVGRGEVDVAGGKLALDGASLSGRYDLKSDILIVNDVKLAGARTAVAGEIRFRNASAFLGVNDKRVSAFDLQLSKLELDMPGFLGAPTALTDVSANGRLLITENAIEVDAATAYLDGVPATATARFALGDDGAGVIRPYIKLDAKLPGAADVRKILAFWPLALDPITRDWSETHLESGQIANARAKLDLRPQDLRGLGIPRERVDVTFDFTGAQVRFMDGLAPVRQGQGSARLEGDRFDLALDAGQLNGLALSKGRVFLPVPRLHRTEPAQYRFTAAGEARAVVEVLRQAPLGVDAALPFVPESITGAGMITVDITTLRPRLDSPNQTIAFEVDGRFDKVSGRFKNDGSVLSDATVTVAGDQRGLTFSGPASLGASRAEVVWTQSLRAGVGPNSRFAIAGRFEAAELAGFGFDLGDAITGPIGMELRGVGEGAQFSTVGVRMNLKDAVLRLPGGFWAKPVGQDATLAFEARRAADGAVSIRDLDLRGAGGLFAAGGAEFGPDRRLKSARFGRFVLGARTQVGLAVDRDASGALLVEAKGSAFDIGPWMGANSAPATPQPAPRATGVPAALPAAAVAAAAPPEAVRVKIQVDRAAMRGDAALTQAVVNLEALGPAVTRLSITGRTPSGAAFELSLGDGEGPGALRFFTEDAGFAVLALTGADNVRGGKASAQGVWRPGAPGRAEFVLQASDFKVVRMGALAELLSSVSSLTGLVDMLNGDGIAFKGLEAPMVLDNGRLSVRDARAAGDSLGITAKGDIDFARGRLALDGVVAPAYGLNALFTDVPVLGPLLTSRPGEGVVGITYTVAGQTDAPKVGVNPLSALAPGIFRRIFEPIAPRDDSREDRPRARPSRAKRTQ